VSHWEQYKVPHIPEGESGDWRIEKFVVSEHEASVSAMRAAMPGSYGLGYVAAGEYTKLVYKKAVIMSDTPDEVRTNMPPVWHARRYGGHILIVGLGLGLVTRAVLMHPIVERVTVVEKSPDVIALVSPHLQDTRLEIVECDIHKWLVPKGDHFGFAWFDIWGDFSGDDLAEMTRLKRRFRRYADVRECWQEGIVRRLARN